MIYMISTEGDLAAIGASGTMYVHRTWLRAAFDIAIARALTRPTSRWAGCRAEAFDVPGHAGREPQIGTLGHGFTYRASGRGGAGGWALFQRRATSTPRGGIAEQGAAAKGAGNSWGAGSPRWAQASWFREARRPRGSSARVELVSLDKCDQAIDSMQGRQTLEARRRASFRCRTSVIVWPNFIAGDSSAHAAAHLLAPTRSD